jgi:hypothetical protein
LALNITDAGNKLAKTNRLAQEFIKQGLIAALQQGSLHV